MDLQYALFLCACFVAGWLCRYAVDYCEDALRIRELRRMLQEHDALWAKIQAEQAAAAEEHALKQRQERQWPDKRVF